MSLFYTVNTGMVLGELRLFMPKTEQFG
jgi:hypothetical protein